MISSLPHKRPNCEEILEKKNSWAMIKEELEISDELENIASNERKNELSIYSMLRPNPN